MDRWNAILQAYGGGVFILQQRIQMCHDDDDDDERKIKTRQKSCVNL